jgi:putative PIN family toxin of toxin-antitoxin system
MIVITDSNVIFSALIDPKSKISKIIREKSKIQFIAPNFLLEEVKLHWEKILQFTSLSNKELEKEFVLLSKRIKFVDIKELPREILFEANEIVKDIDEDDTYFVALYLYQKHKIWTGDRKLINGLKKKGYDICITTSQLKAFIYKKNI